jgi:hypothetical protein
MTSGPESSILADAEIAGLEAFNFLRSQPIVDEKNIGITGFSWGGYSTTMLSGLLGKKVKAAYAVYGCGFYEKGSFWKHLIDTLPGADRQIWLKYLDAGRRAPQIKAHFFTDAASNDTYFWPEAVQSTMNAIRENKNHLWEPNLNHKQGPSGKIMQQLYFDYYLKRSGNPFGKIKISEVIAGSDGSKKVIIQIEIPKNVKVTSVLLYYCEKTSDWQSRKWIPLTATYKKGNRYEVIVSASLTAINVDYYACLTDERNVSVSSLMYQASSSF